MTDAGLLERFARLACDEPDRILVHEPSAARSLTTSELARAAHDLGRALARAGVGRNHLLVSALGNHHAFLTLMLAGLELGLAILPVDRGTPYAGALELATRFGGSAVVLPDDGGATDEQRHIPLPDGLVLAWLGEPNVNVPLPAGAAMLKLTSGSTGLPKATVTTAANLVADGEAIVEAMAIRPGDVQTACIPLAHAYGLGNLVMPLLLQGTAIVLRDQFVPSQVVQDAARYGTRVFAGVPFMFEHLLAHLPADDWPASLETLITAGARLEPSTARRFAERFGVRIHSLYGSSETGGITFDRAADPDDATSVGTPLPRVTVTLRAHPGAPEGTGRVHVRGPAVSSGYAGQPVDIGSPFVDGGFLTGDLGRLDGHGRLVLSGRVSSFINVAGRKVQPEEVERVLSAMPGIVDARVLGVPDALRGQRLIACIVTRDADLRPIDIRQFCAGRLAAHKIPRAFVLVDDLPRDARGKTDRRALEALVRARMAADEPS
jgi:acyl-CoA synthetase (AMP-forming)/AMP-acid ligase II